MIMISEEEFLQFYLGGYAVIKYGNTFCVKIVEFWHLENGFFRTSNNPIWTPPDSTNRGTCGISTNDIFITEKSNYNVGSIIGFEFADGVRKIFSSDPVSWTEVMPKKQLDCPTCKNTRRVFWHEAGMMSDCQDCK